MSQISLNSEINHRPKKLAGNTNHQNDIHVKDKLSKAVFGAAFDGDVEELRLLLSPSKMIGEDQIRDIISYQDEEGNSVLHRCIHGAVANKKDQRSARVLDCCGFILSLGVPIDMKDKYGRTALHWCVLYGRLDLLAFLHQSGCDFMVFDQSGFSPLHFAIGIRSEKLRNELIEYFCTLAPMELLEAVDGQERNPLFLSLSIGALNVFQCLLYAKANPNGFGPDGRHLIIHAIEKGEGRFTELLLKYGASLSTNDPDNFTAIHLAACQKNPQNIFVLTELVNKTLLNVKDHLGRTPLMYACLMGFDKNVKLLLDQKIWILDKDNEGKTALHHTVSNTHCGCVDLLCWHNPNIVDIPSHLGYTATHDAVIAGNGIILNALLGNGANVNARDNGGHTLTHWATAHGAIDCLRILLQHDALFDERDNHGATPVHYSCQKDSKDYLNTARLEALDILLNKNAKMCTADKEGRKPLHWATSSGNTSALKLLVKHGDDINSTTKEEEMTALHMASFQGSTNVVDFLVKQNGILLEPHDVMGCTPLFYACASGHSSITEKLLKAGANPNLTTKDGETPCHCAASVGSIECLQLLLDSGVDLSSTNALNDTPLHEAASSGKHDTVLFLLDNGCQSTVQNRSGATPLHYSVAERHSNIAKLLLERNAKVNALVMTNKTVYVTPLDIALGNNDLTSIQLLQQYGARTGHSIVENSALIIQNRWRVYRRKYSRADSCLKSDLSDSVSTHKYETRNEIVSQTDSNSQSNGSRVQLDDINNENKDCMTDKLEGENHATRGNSDSAASNYIECKSKTGTSAFKEESSTTQLTLNNSDSSKYACKRMSSKDSKCSLNAHCEECSNTARTNYLIKTVMDQVASSKAECRRNDSLMDRAEKLKKKIEIVLKETKEIRSNSDYISVIKNKKCSKERQRKLSPIISLPDVT